MGKTSPLQTVFILFLIPMLLGIVYLDIAGVFSYSDIPFIFASFLYLLFVVAQKAQSRASFLLALFFLIWMGLSYVPTGAGATTERIGEWFFIFFVFGIVQYMKESWNQKAT